MNEMHMQLKAKLDGPPISRPGEGKSMEGWRDPGKMGLLFGKFFYGDFLGFLLGALERLCPGQWEMN